MSQDNQVSPLEKWTVNLAAALRGRGDEVDYVLSDMLVALAQPVNLNVVRYTLIRLATEIPHSNLSDKQIIEIRGFIWIVAKHGAYCAKEEE